jgi:hypothetical protein
VSDESSADDAAATNGLLRRTLDLCMFAPIGVAMNIIEDLPGLIDKGRERVEQEISAMPAWRGSTWWVASSGA